MLQSATPPPRDNLKTEETYYPVRGNIACRRDLSSSAKLMLAYIHFRIGGNWYAWPGQREIADHLGMDRKTVQRALAELAGKGLLEIVRGGPHYTSQYFERSTPQEARANQENGGGEKGPPAGEKRDRTAGEKRGQIINIKETENKQGIGYAEKRPVCPTPAAVKTADLDKLMAEYEHLGGDMPAGARATARRHARDTGHLPDAATLKRANDCGRKRFGTEYNGLGPDTWQRSLDMEAAQTRRNATLQQAKADRLRGQMATREAQQAEKVKQQEKQKAAAKRLAGFRSLSRDAQEAYIAAAHDDNPMLTSPEIIERMAAATWATPKTLDRLAI